MLGSEILEIAIGFVFVILIASLTATTLREFLEAILKTRSIQLERGLRELLDDPDGTGITKKLFDHPLLDGLFAGDYVPGRLTSMWTSWRPKMAQTENPPPRPKRMVFGSNLPSYIPSRNFALALLGHTSGEGILSLDSITANAVALPEGRLKKALMVSLGEAEGDLDRLRTSLEAWFDGTMDRVAGWYKRETQWTLLAFGLFLAVALNIDSVGIVRQLATNNALREALVARVDTTPLPAGKTLSERQLLQRVEDLSDLIGWQRLDAERLGDALQAVDGAITDEGERTRRAMDALPSRVPYLLRMVPGWLVTALAVSLGAPFWFDLLDKLMVIRSTVKPNEKSPPKAPTAA